MNDTTPPTTAHEDPFAGTGQGFTDWYAARTTPTGGVEIWDAPGRLDADETPMEPQPRVSLDRDHAQDIHDYLRWGADQDSAERWGPVPLTFDGPDPDGEAFHLDPNEVPGLFSFLDATEAERTAATDAQGAADGAIDQADIVETTIYDPAPPEYDEDAARYNAEIARAFPEDFAGWEDPDYGGIEEATRLATGQDLPAWRQETPTALAREYPDYDTPIPFHIVEQYTHQHTAAELSTAEATAGDWREVEAAGEDWAAEYEAYESDALDADLDQAALDYQGAEL